MADPPELHEDVELDLAHRRYLLDVYGRLAQLSHYELLGIERTADEKAIRRAYFTLARTTHPDRYFGKRLGSYKAKLEAVFARMTKAYETLANTGTRAAYDAELAKTAGAVVHSAAPVDPTTAARKQAVLADLDRRLAESRARAAQHTQAAARALAAGDVTAAAEAYRQAVQLAPRDTALRAAYEEVLRTVAKRTCEAYRRQAALEERHQHWEQAAASWRRVLEADPRDAEARARLAAALARAASRPPG